MYASERGYYQIVEKLVQEGAQEYLVYKNASLGGDENSVSTELYLAVIGGNRDLVENLVKNADDSVKTGEMALTIALRENNKTIISMLIDEYPSLLNKEIDNKYKGFSSENKVLMIAANAGYLDIVNILIQKSEVLDENFKNEFLNSADPFGMTALMYASEGCYEQIVESLVLAGAKIGLVDEMGYTALHHALFLCDLGVVKVLVNKSKEFSDKDKEEFLNKLNSEGAAALHMAAMKCQKEIFDILLDAGSSLYLLNRDGRTVLHYAAQYDDEGFISFIFDKIKNLDEKAQKAFLNSVDKDGMTALHCAAMAGRKGNVRELIEAGADVSLKDGSGKTAQNLAADNGRPDIADMLVDRSGKTAQNLAGSDPIFNLSSSSRRY